MALGSGASEARNAIRMRDGRTSTRWHPRKAQIPAEYAHGRLVGVFNRRGHSVRQSPCIISSVASSPIASQCCSYWLLTAPVGAVQPGGFGAQKSPDECS
jgi:hypothetical protein